MFHEESYKNHGEWYNKHFPTAQSKSEFFNKHSAAEKTIGNWLQRIFFSCLAPLFSNSWQDTWLTVGDAYGFDAEYLIANGVGAVTATDLNSDFLKIAKEQGIIDDYAAENAEQLSFGPNAFDYVLCKESYHHFPRPYAALYEMIRVTRKAVVLMEPQDPISKMPVLLALSNFAARINPALIKYIWKNRFSYEPVGNYVYKVSEREFEKFAAGLDLPMVAFKQINPNFYHKNLQQIKSEFSEFPFKIILLKKCLIDLMMYCQLIPGQVLSAILFKEKPAGDEITRLKKAGYKLVTIPKNPYQS